MHPAFRNFVLLAIGWVLGAGSIGGYAHHKLNSPELRFRHAQQCLKAAEEYVRQRQTNALPNEIYDLKEVAFSPTRSSCVADVTDDSYGSLYAEGYEVVDLFTLERVS